MNKDSSHQSADVIADEVRSHLHQNGPTSCIETKQQIIDFLEKEKKLTQVEVTHREWPNSEARFYVAFSFDNTVIEHAIINRHIKKQLARI